MLADTALMVQDETIKPQGRGPAFQTVMEPDFLAVRNTSLKIDNHLAAHQLPADDHQNCSIALTEALNNIVEHGFANLDSGEIRIALTVGVTTIRAVLTDDGRAMPGFQLPEGAAPDPIDLPEGGFGWFMIKSLSRSQTYERCGEMNVLTLEFSRGHEN